MKNSTKVKVAYRDTDAGKVVYYANYLSWFELGRMEYLHQLGIYIKNLEEKDKLGFIVKHAELDFKAPARLEDVVIIETEIKEINKASILFHQKAIREVDQVLLVEGKVLLVTVGAENLKPVAIPEKLKKQLEQETCD
ncbi:MAG: YbgC/FadM family acyl-CoA thioesterase [Candidatus Saganbacteria bacterium]|nr:YbgC/FadM family acyl-CoA thioesterase [Candidatus Saganbacteria bacterium]